MENWDKFMRNVHVGAPTRGQIMVGRQEKQLSSALRRHEMLSREFVFSEGE